MGLTPNPPPDDGDASDVGRPPFGVALYYGASHPLAKPVTGLLALSGHDR